MLAARLASGDEATLAQDLDHTRLEIVVEAGDFPALRRLVEVEGMNTSRVSL